jgi:GMP synthase (glutamine-hydrolysing)
MRIHWLQHVPFEDLGIIEQWAGAKAHNLSATRVYENGALPAKEEIDFLVIMGGPMSVWEEDKYPWLTRERRFIKDAIRENKTVLGICLGAQLIVDVLGARIYPSRHKEIGWFPIVPTDAARGSKIFSFLADPLTVFHWHGDTFDLPHGAIRMAESNGCQNQAYVFGSNVIGMQFHLEVTLDSVQTLRSKFEAESQAWDFPHFSPHC